ncbi:hypothetical protein PVA17_22000 [Lysinibacillus sp. CNPSo 3705]|uniref:hypothetical protein n=1 Tax=Lysinibacillus sp. CNPSo 3705 TaxID=3028148 RepID=UPI002363959C|nr:hypothetical protein [Lysinibacillus sp. CNPSo 3705]MDD1505398.1 hypothetical protein [Lysinibacillus sp. CNPSo 3705]
MNNKYYEERVIAFIDILGFQEHVTRSETDANHSERLHNALAYLSSIKTDNYKGAYPQNDLGREVSVFSDSIVISYPLTFKSASFYLLLDIIHIQLDMMNAGILVRGGVTVGKLYHSDGVVYGPAMNEAYQIESKYAIYPRVVVEKKVIIEGVKNSLHDPLLELEYIKGLIKEDEDHQFFIDYISQWQEIDDEESYLYALDVTKDLVVNEIQKQTNPNILLKYNWLKRYYNSTLDKLNSNYTKDRYIK